MHWTPHGCLPIMRPRVIFVDEVVVGLQWGDEGKGKFVDERSDVCTAVVRFQGGGNAGHTVWFGGEKHVLHQVPCGALRPDCVAVIAAGCAVDPETLRDEVLGLGLSPDRLLVSSRAQIVTPWFRAVDGAEELLRGPFAVGTTGQGIGPAYVAKAARVGITVGEFVDDLARSARMEVIRPATRRWLGALGLPSPRIDADHLGELAAWLRPLVGDDLAAIRAARKHGRVLFEGQLGLMRDPDRGCYPYTTSASVLPPAALVGSGARVIGVAKPYVTVVGAGQFPTEAPPAEAAVLARAGDEFGATTGRARRVGWVDLPALRYAVAATGATHLALQMKMGGLMELGRMPVCVGYQGWDEGRGFPQTHELGGVRPVMEDWPLPTDAAGVLGLARRIADALDLPLLYVGTGRSRGDCLWTGGGPRP